MKKENIRTAFVALSCSAVAFVAPANQIVWQVTNLYKPASATGAVDASFPETKAGEGDVRMEIYEMTAGSGGWLLWQSGENLANALHDGPDNDAFILLGRGESDSSGSVSATIEPKEWSSAKNYYIAVFFSTVSDVDGETREWFTAFKPNAGDFFNPSPYRISDGDQTISFTTLQDNTYKSLPWYPGAVVPEPGTAALALIGLCLMLKGRRKRH